MVAGPGYAVSVAAKKESVVDRYKRRILRGTYKRSEYVMLYPFMLLNAGTESALLPLPMLTSNGNYLRSSPRRRVFSVVARVIQILLSTLVFLGCVAVMIGCVAGVTSKDPDFGAIWQTALLFVGAVSVMLFSVLHILLSVTYTRWLIRNFRSEWSTLRY